MIRISSAIRHPKDIRKIEDKVWNSIIIVWIQIKGGVLKPNRYYDPILIGGVVGIWDIKKRILQTAW